MYWENILLFFAWIPHTIDVMHLKIKAGRYFYILSMLRHQIVGCGIPVAFMRTSSETRVPLDRWLEWLELSARLMETPTFIIDCSVSELAATKAAFDGLEIRFCPWLFFFFFSCTERLGEIVQRSNLMKVRNGELYVNCLNEIKRKFHTTLGQLSAGITRA